jgi:succinate dehydrogenase / fumarate reductase cytochrome b subunit
MRLIHGRLVASSFMQNEPARIVSSVAIKAAVAASGILLWGWVALHMLGLLIAFAPGQAIDRYAAQLHGSPGLLWSMRAGLLAVALVHVTASAGLARRAQRARGPERMRARHRTLSVASRAMRAGGVLLLGFSVFHVLHMTTGTLHPAFAVGHVHANLVRGLSSPAIASAYLLAALVLGAHLLHGLWSAPRSLGLYEQRARSLRRPLSLLVALMLALGFASVPVAVLAGVLR